MQKGYKRNGKGMAVLRFFIGLIILAILLGVVYFFILKVDYSDKVADPDATMRAYVEMTASPDGVSADDDEIGEGDDINFTNIIGDEEDLSDAELFGDEGGDEDFIDLTATEEPTAEPTEEPTPEPTEEPTPEPTEEPTPEPTVEPTATPQPTKIPRKSLANPITKGRLPSVKDSDTVKATNVYVSQPDGSKIVEVSGYAYIDEETYDCASAQLFLIVQNKTSKDFIAYKCRKVEGISGVDHSTALCKNPEKSDFDVCFSTAYYKNFDWGLGLIIAYKTDKGKIQYNYYNLGESFTTKNHKAQIAETGFVADGETADGEEPVPFADGNDVPFADAIEDENAVPEDSYVEGGDVYEGDVSDIGDFFNEDAPVITQVG